jgi:hypothetical protein
MDAVKAFYFVIAGLVLLVIGHGRPYIESPLRLNPCKTWTFCG